jgi:DNA-binding PadR family transcriptional regulator
MDHRIYFWGYAGSPVFLFCVKPMKFENEQRKIDVHQTAFRILRMMIRYGNDGLRWTVGTFGRAIYDVKPDVILEALRWLESEKYIEASGSCWYLTREGQEAVQDMRAAKYQTGAIDLEFKREALTGMDAMGDQSTLDRAALPKCGYRNQKDPEEATITKHGWIDLIKKIAVELQISDSETCEGLKSGRIRKCKGIDGVAPHWGVFHRHNSKRGQRWQALCIDCRKKQRRGSR